MNKILLFSLLSLSIAFSQPDLCSMRTKGNSNNEKDILELLDVDSKDFPLFTKEKQKIAQNKFRVKLEQFIDTHNFKGICELLEQVFSIWWERALKNKVNDYWNFSRLYNFIFNTSLKLNKILEIAMNYGRLEIVKLILENHERIFLNLQELYNKNTTNKKKLAHFNSYYVNEFKILDLIEKSITEGHIKILEYLMTKIPVYKPEIKFPNNYSELSYLIPKMPIYEPKSNFQYYLLLTLHKILSKRIFCKKNEPKIIKYFCAECKKGGLEINELDKKILHKQITAIIKERIHSLKNYHFFVEEEK